MMSTTTETVPMEASPPSTPSFTKEEKSSRSVDDMLKDMGINNSMNLVNALAATKEKTVFTKDKTVVLVESFGSDKKKRALARARQSMQKADLNEKKNVSKSERKQQEMDKKFPLLGQKPVKKVSKKVPVKTIYVGAYDPLYLEHKQVLQENQHLKAKKFNKPTDKDVSYAKTVGDNPTASVNVVFDKQLELEKVPRVVTFRASYVWEGDYKRLMFTNSLDIDERKFHNLKFTVIEDVQDERDYWLSLHKVHTVGWTLPSKQEKYLYAKKTDKQRNHEYDQRDSIIGVGIQHLFTEKLNITSDDIILEPFKNLEKETRELIDSLTAATAGRFIDKPLIESRVTSERFLVGSSEKNKGKGKKTPTPLIINMVAESQDELSVLLVSTQLETKTPIISPVAPPRRCIIKDSPLNELEVAYTTRPVPLPRKKVKDTKTTSKEDPKKYLEEVIIEDLGSDCPDNKDSVFYSDFFYSDSEPEIYSPVVIKRRHRRTRKRQKNCEDINIYEDVDYPTTLDTSDVLQTQSFSSKVEQLVKSGIITDFNHDYVNIDETITAQSDNDIINDSTQLNYGNINHYKIDSFIDIIGVTPKQYVAGLYLQATLTACAYANEQENEIFNAIGNLVDYSINFDQKYLQNAMNILIKFENQNQL